MTRRAFRVLLFLGLLGAAALAGYQGWKLERARLRQLASADAFNLVTLRLAHSVIDLRASERAYVSSGQGFAYWKPRVDALVQQIRQDLTTLKTSAAVNGSNPDATPAADAALDALNETVRLEKRIADAAEAGRIPFAADIVYADGLQASLALERATDTAILAAKTDLAAYQRDARIQELILAAESASIGLFLALMWFPSQQKPAPAAVPKEPAHGILGVSHLDLPLRPEPDTRSAGSQVAARTTAPPASSTSAANKREESAAAAARGIGGGATVARGGGGAGATRDTGGPSAAAADRRDARGGDAAGAARGGGLPGSGAADAAAAQALPAPVVATTPGAGREVLSAAADLCTSLARVTDANELTGLVAQMASQLEAMGVIVWLVAPDGLSLRPALSHGYGAEALGRLGVLDLASDNATARAFRLVRPQTVAGRDSAPGAIVVPITAGAGCVGAIAAELRQGREQDAGTMALARIFAAQLGTLTGPASGASPASSASSASSSSAS